MNPLPLRILFAFLALSALLLPVCRAQGNLETEAQALLDDLRSRANLVGVSAAVSRDGEIVWEGGSGYRDREAEIPADGDMLHRIASITKSMTATAIMQLVENGDVKLNTPLQKYLPDFPKSDRGTIRIRHLLTHTSGMRHYKGNENRPFEHYDTLDDALAVFQDRPIAFKPGDRYLYTTYGYTVLGAVIEKVSGMTYAEYMTEYIWRPSGMTSTALERRGQTEAHQSKLYRIETDGAVIEDDYTDLSIKYPGGGVVSTAGDLVRFANAFESGKLLKPSTRKQMFEVPNVDRRRVPYGLGWMVWENERYGRYYHNDGGQSGTSTYLLVIPEHKLAVAVMANVARVGGDVSKTAFALADLAIQP